MNHQIMVFVGNGFDIAVLKKYGKGITTSYDSFYSFFKYRYPNVNDNFLIQQMEKAKTENKENWSDFESILEKTLTLVSKIDDEWISKLNENLIELQNAFSWFLNDIIDKDVINNISKANDILISNKDNCAKKIMRCSFVKDLSQEQYLSFAFHNKFNNNETIKYVFVNFNYTSLLDNYLYLKKDVFDPTPFVTSSNNIVLDLNPNKYDGHLGYSDPYVRLLPLDIIHPHGVQDVPKSLLFGIENRDYVAKRDMRRIFVKSIWAQYQEKFNNKFDATELFIIFGCSIGESDNWWWRRVFCRLAADSPAELIIYNYGNESSCTIKDRFIENCCFKNITQADKEKVKNNIYVINFGFSDTPNIEFMQLPDIGHTI